MRKPLLPSRAGSALIVVLSILALLTVLVLVLLFRVRTEMTLSQDYASQVNAKTLSESAINLAIEQIRSGSSNVGQAWISQPGLIRTFDNTGNPVMAYKLYSSDQMTVTGNWSPTTDTMALKTDNWASQPNLYVDLNSPVMVSSSPSTAVFPIVDGNNMKMLTVGNQTLLTYSTNTGGVPDVEGFGIDLANANYAVTSNYAAGSTVSTTNNPVPMPVKWLYVLKDGSLLSAVVTGLKDVRVGGGTGPSPTLANPVVGRIAFWTDDDTCKVDINTAGEGTYWDTPVGSTQPSGLSGNIPTNNFDPDNTYETDLAAREPVANEFQHTPGHPATTCLSTVLGASMRDALGLPSGNSTLTGANQATLVEAIDNLSPYLNDTDSKGNPAGSLGGTANTNAGATIASTPVSTKTNRRYANADELFYNPPSSSGRTPQPLASAANIAPLVAESRFFLTAHSSAPEVNLFGKPRVAIWPVPLATRTAFDQQIALCSTVGNGTTAEPFYFSRSDPTSQTKDWTTRNGSIYTYLTGLAASNWPGYGGNFASKYALDYKQIFTEIFDYIRCVNLCDPTPGATQFAPYSLSADRLGSATSPAQGQVVPIAPTGTGTRGFGRIATISDLALLMIKEDTRWDQAQAENATLTLNPKTAVPLTAPYPLNYQGPQPQNGTTYLNSTRVEFSLIPQLFCPMAGSPPLANNLRFKFSNNTITVTDANGTQSPFSAVTEPTLYDVGRVPTSGLPSALFGGYIGPGVLTQAAYGTSTTGAPADSNFPTGQAVVAGLPSSLTTKGSPPTLVIKGSVQVDVYAPNGGSIPIQTFQFSLPSGGLVVPIPNLAQNGPTPGGTFPPYGSYGTVANYTAVNGLPYGNLTTGRGIRALSGIEIFPYLNTTVPTSVKSGNFDVVRTLELSGANTNGDIRLVSGRASIPSTWFVPQNTSTAAAAATTYLAYNFYNPTPRNFFDFYGTQVGNLIPGLPTKTYLYYGGDAAMYPPLPENVSAITSGVGGPGVLNSLKKPGDWDNGQGAICDGPYLNKSDEGAVPSTSATNDNGPVASWPYFGTLYSCWDYGMISSPLFIPSRQIPSPVMFGSLPTGVLSGQPWQTLLFRPAKSYFPGGNNHPGAAVPNPVDGVASYPPYTAPPDHCLLDLFWMPTVQPYPISQPFATSGKINLNYQIAPFTYIERSTGIRAVLKSVKIAALNPTQKAGTTYMLTAYKATGPGGYGGVGVSVRRSIDLDKTVQEIEGLYFSANKPFISESQICDVPLVPLDNLSGTYVNTGIPSGLSAPAASTFDGYLANFWAKNNLTGDNSLERPYAAIYPRITTKSNTYTVHVWVQTLKQLTGASASADPAVFRDGIDRVTGEYRGSFAVERYLDPNTSGFYKNGAPDTGSNPEQDASAVLGPYKFRVLSTRQFNP